MAVDLLTCDDGYEITVHELGGNGPTLLFVHAASLCAAVFRPLAAALADDFLCVAPDLRGHGRSREASSAVSSWSRLGDDIAEVLDHLEGAVFGFGHSLGATALLLGASRRIGRVRAVVAYEPVVLHGAESARFADSQAARSERRHASFPSADDARERLCNRPPFDRLEPGALEGYLRDGFVARADGSVALVFDPHDEAALYRAGVGLDLDDELERVTCPVTIVTGEKSEHAIALGADHLASTLSNVSLAQLHGCSHFGPLEDTKATAALIRRALGTTAA